MIRTRNWIYYSTMALISGVAIATKIGTFTLEAFYVLMAINLSLMLLIKKLWLPRGLAIFFLFLLSSGALGIFRHTDTASRVAKEFLGVSVSAFYFCSFFRVINFGLEDSFRLYAKMVYWVQIIGLTIYPFQYFLIGPTRYHGLMGESSWVAYICLPPLYYYVDCWQKERKHGKEIIVLLLAFLLADSSTAFIGLSFGILLFMRRYRKAIALIPVILYGFFLVVYTTSSYFQERATDTYNVFTRSDMSGTNLSTYVLYTNFYVMENVLKVHPIMGNGFGSHGKSFFQYIGYIDTSGFGGTEYEDYNSEDACSLGIRVASDFGLLGIFLMIGFIWHYRPKGNTELDVMRTAIWLYFFTKIIRGGTYFDNQQFFYICFYALAPVVVRVRYSKLVRASQQKQPLTVAYT